WDYNVAVTKAVTDMAHLGGISVEGELGVLGSLETGEGDKEDGHGAEGKLCSDQLLANPDEAVKFARHRRSMRWPSPWAPVTAPTSSAASPTAPSWRCMSSRKSTASCRTRTLSCTGPPRSRKTCRRASTGSGEARRRPIPVPGQLRRPTLVSLWSAGSRLSTSRPAGPEVDRREPIKVLGWLAAAR